MTAGVWQSSRWRSYRLVLGWRCESDQVPWSARQLGPPPASRACGSVRMARAASRI